MLLFGKRSSRHIPWLLFCAIAAALAFGWCYVSRSQVHGWPTGGTEQGFVVGVVAGLIVLFECLIWPRKIVRSWRLFGSAQRWMRAHIWLGILSLPLVLLHTGFRFGGHFNATFLVLFLLVIASGGFGLLMQNLLPWYLLRRLPAETIYAAIPDVSRKLADEARDLVQAACGDTYSSKDDWKAVTPIPGEREQGTLVVGEVVRRGLLGGKTLTTVATVSRVENAKLLREQFQQAIYPFLVEGRSVEAKKRHKENRIPKLSNDQRAIAYFSDLRMNLQDVGADVVDHLESACARRRQFDTQITVHWWLHGWLAVHAGLSVALLIMLAVHVVFALKYL